MAYHYAKYVDYIAAAGRLEYDIPLFTNVWQNNSSPAAAAAGGNSPGKYPRGGAVANVLDIWQAFAKTLDWISLDIYLNEYEERCQWYTHKNQILFIPEQRRDEFGARRLWRAIGEYGAIGACPFGIDTLDEQNPYVKHFELLHQVELFVLKAQQKPERMTGFYFDEFEDGETLRLLNGDETQSGSCVMMPSEAPD